MFNLANASQDRRRKDRKKTRACFRGVLEGVTRPANSKGPSELAGARLPRVGRVLFKLAGDARKLGIEVGAEAVHNRNNCDRDASSDQAILDGGRARIVFQEAQCKRFHDMSSLLPVASSG
jgi:hypothetical protein